MKKLILASQSPRRKELLENKGLTVDVMASHIREVIKPHLSPEENAISLAEQKARSIANKADGIIIAADSIVVFNSDIIGKPKDKDDARQILGRLSGNSHQVITGFCILDTETNRAHTEAATTTVTLKYLSPQMINDYVDTHNPIDKAGAYGIQEVNDPFVEKIEGSYSNVVGLPVDEVIKALKLFQI